MATPAPSILVPLNIHGQILQELGVQLPRQHQSVLDAFLVQCTAPQVHTLKVRLYELSSVDFHAVVGRLSSVSLRKLQHLLALSINKAEREEDTKPRCKSPHTGEHDNRLANVVNRSKPQALLRQSLFNVPQEMYDIILESLFQQTYLPGRVVAGEYPVFDGDDCFLNVGFSLGKSIVLRRVDPVLYQRYKEAYWTQNTWEIQEGLLSYTMDFLQLLPDEHCLKIRSLAVSFSIQDCEKAHSYCHWYHVDKSLLENLEIYDDEYRTFTLDQHDCWFWRFYHVTGLKLKKLRLDFTNAVSIEGEFLGLETVAGFGKFEHGMPELTIVAPTVELGNQIYDIIKAKNSTEEDS